MKASILYLILMCFFTSPLNAQYGYLGRKKAFGIGIASNFPLITSNSGPYGTKLEKGGLLPKVSVEFLRENRKGNAFFLQSEFQTLPNAQTNYYVYNGSMFNVIIREDTIRSRSNSVRLSIGLKKHYSIGIIGGYFGFRGSGSITSNKSIHSSTVTSIKSDYNTKEIIRSSKQESGITFIPSVSFMFGKTYPLSRRSILDIGFDANLTFGKFSSYKNISISVLDSYLHNKIINSKQLLTTNGLVVYVKIYLL